MTPQMMSKVWCIAISSILFHKLMVSRPINLVRKLLPHSVSSLSAHPHPCSNRYNSLSNNTGLLLLCEVAAKPFYEQHEANYNADADCKAAGARLASPPCVLLPHY